MGSKIVRDNVADWAKEHGVSGVWRVSEDPIKSLRKKLGEELGEYIEDWNPGELFDLRDVIAELIYLEDPLHDYRESHLRKVQRLGKFAKHIEWSPVPEEHEGKEIP